MLKNNKFEYRKLIPYCKEKGFAYIPSTLITSKMNGNKSTTSLRLESDDFSIVFKEIEKYLKKEDIFFEKFDENNSPCPAIRYAINIDSQGDVYPCNSFYFKVGNIYENDLEYIWNHSEGYKYLNGLKNSSSKECGKCDMRDYCTRCPGHALLEDGDLLGCSSIDKRHAMMMCREMNRKE